MTLRGNLERTVRQVGLKLGVGAIPPPAGDEIAAIRRAELLTAARQLPLAVTGNIVVAAVRHIGAVVARRRPRTGGLDGAIGVPALLRLRLRAAASRRPGRRRRRPRWTG